MDLMEFKANDGERDILFSLENELPKKVVNAVTESVKTMLLDAENTDARDVYGDYSRSLKIRQASGTTVAEAIATIRFCSVSDYEAEKGWQVIIKGKISDGHKEYESEWTESPAGFIWKGKISDLVAIMENVGLTDWTYTRIELFFEYLRDNLAELEDTPNEETSGQESA